MGVRAYRLLLPSVSRAAILASASTIPELAITASGHFFVAGGRPSIH
jgi:hypothetical protein